MTGKDISTSRNSYRTPCGKWALHSHWHLNTVYRRQTDRFLCIQSDMQIDILRRICSSLFRVIDPLSPLLLFFKTANNHDQTAFWWRSVQRGMVRENMHCVLTSRALASHLVANVSLSNNVPNVWPFPEAHILQPTMPKPPYAHANPYTTD